MGNGPSLTSLLEDPGDHLVDKDIFVVNYFGLTDYFDLVRPNYYVILDDGMLNVDSRNKQAENLILKLNNVTWEMVICVPAHCIESELISSLKNDKLFIVGFNSTPVDNGITFIENFLYKLNLGMPFPQTVINAVIFLALNLKYDVINLYGVEQSWLRYLTVNSDNQVNVGLPHFYAGPSDLGRHSTLSTLSTFLLTQVFCFASHMRLGKYAEYRGLTILNHTPGSYIDAYQRVPHEYGP